MTILDLSWDGIVRMIREAERLRARKLLADAFDRAVSDQNFERAVAMRDALLVVDEVDGDKETGTKNMEAGS